MAAKGNDGAPTLAQIARNSDYEAARNALIPEAEAYAHLRAGPYPGGKEPKGPGMIDREWAAKWNIAFHSYMCVAAAHRIS